jgi:hypothetical protein
MVAAIGTRFVCLFELDDGTRVACNWSGGHQVIVYVARGGEVRLGVVWNAWNDAWDCPLFRHDGEAFEAYCQLRLSEPGVVEQLLDQLPA